MTARLASRLLAGLLVLGACNRVRSETVSVLVHEGGEPRQVPAETSAGRALVQACESTLLAADNVLRLMPTEALLGELRASATSVEIRYPSRKRFVLGPPLSRTLEASALLVPVTGEYAGSPATIFYDDGDGYAAGPLRSDRGSSAVAEAVAASRGVDAAAP